MINQFADIPGRICPTILPQYNVTLIRQSNNNTGLSNYTVELMLESDPAALQALQSVNVKVTRYDPSFPRTPANEFVSYYTCTYIRIVYCDSGSNACTYV